ncbi:MAG: hypothetical protein AUK29_08355 [Nitrospirae bacterium CG2_30_53_67]|nr:MAG: hypothetical protein AUK29_08355 [Nitrospirae bacterium CG2_30_53_67]
MIFYRFAFPMEWGYSTGRQWKGMLSMNYTHLFQPGRIGSLSLKNRILMPLYPTKYATESRVNERMIAFYKARAKGGAALIVLDCPCLDYPAAYKGKNELRMDEPSFVEGIRSLLKEIRPYGTRAFMHLSYPHEQVFNDKVSGAEPKGNLWVRPCINFVNTEEIYGIMDRMAEGAAKAREIGYDGVDLQASYGDFIAQLLSPLTNQRNDEFGGTLENRARFLTGLIRKIKQNAGSDFPVMVKLVCNEFTAGGLTLNDGRQIARMAEASGADLIVASGGNKKTKYKTIPPHSSPPAPLLDLAAGIKEEVLIPVAAIGKINTPDLADRILMEGKADFVGMVRALLADPFLPEKAQSGNTEEIRFCIYCLEDCAQDGVPGLGRSCTVNPFAGQEAALVMTPPPMKKKVVIVGGGPAGMQAAILCAERGHRVILFEKEKELGGQFLYADRAPFKEENAKLLKYLNTMIRKYRITVHLETQAGVDEVLSGSPDAVILATGSRPRIPDIPKINFPFVYDYREYYKENPYVGKRVAIIGGGDIGCETADRITTPGREVTVVEMQETLLPAMKDIPREDLLTRLKEKQVTILTGFEAVCVECGLLQVRDKEGKLSPVRADTIIIAAGAVSDAPLLHPLREKIPDVYVIGEAVRPGNAGNALRSAASLAVRL